MWEDLSFFADFISGLRHPVVCTSTQGIACQHASAGLTNTNWQITALLRTGGMVTSAALHLFYTVYGFYQAPTSGKWQPQVTTSSYTVEINPSNITCTLCSVLYLVQVHNVRISLWPLPLLHQIFVRRSGHLFRPGEEENTLSWKGKFVCLFDNHGYRSNVKQAAPVLCHRLASVYWRQRDGGAVM